MDRPRMFDDLAGLAGGAFSALVGLREEIESVLRARLDEAIQALDLVRREEFEAVARIEALEARLPAPTGGGGPGMIA